MSANSFYLFYSFTAALMPAPKVGLWEHYHIGPFKGSDIDLFVFGKTIAQANKKVYREKSGRREGRERM